MKLIAPTTFVAATHLVSSNATEAYSAWAVGTTYAKDAFVDYGTHIYQSLVNSNTGNQPDISPTQWVLIGPDNTHAMFDDQVSTATTRSSPLTVVLATGLANAMALFGLVGTQATITVTDGAGGPTVYSRTVNLDGTFIFDWYQYFFEPYVQIEELVLTDLPPYPSARMTVSVSGAGTVAVGHALRSIRDGHTDVALCGGAEFVGDPVGGVFRAFDAAKTLATVVDRPETANRPFDRGRTGFLLGEGGAAVLVCEEWEHARRRGGRVYAELVGYGESFDAYSPMIAEPGGGQFARAITSSLADAGITPDAIDYVNAHGTGTVVNDEVESAVIEELFGPRPLVNATKSLTGHCLGATGAIEAAITAMSLHRQQVHGCVNLDDPVRPLNFARRSTAAPLTWAVSQSSAFGGHNAAVVMRQAGP